MRSRAIAWTPPRLDRRRFVSLAIAGALTPNVAGRAFSQGWPSRFVKLVVPFPPGGGTDAIARIVSGKLSEIWGQQVVVENRGGAATNIGTEAVARAEPDGYTLLLCSLNMAVNRYLFPTLTYDPVGDFAPVSLICDYPNVMAVPITHPAHSVAEFIAYARANKGKVAFASSGHGTSVHLSAELFKRLAQVEMLHVPYRGAGPALNDLLPGRVDVMFNNIGAVLPLIQSGRLRGLAVTTARRTPAAPDRPLPKRAPPASTSPPGTRSLRRQRPRRRSCARSTPTSLPPLPIRPRGSGWSSSAWSWSARRQRSLRPISSPRWTNGVR
jgi:tripartite-type tricarboxylate transporter receptor subunit TctC